MRTREEETTIYKKKNNNNPVELANKQGKKGMNET